MESKSRFVNRLQGRIACFFARQVKINSRSDSLPLTAHKIYRYKDNLSFFPLMIYFLFRDWILIDKIKFYQARLEKIK